MSAILTDNGGTDASQAEWRGAENAVSIKRAGNNERLLSNSPDGEGVWIDPVTTASTSQSAESTDGESEPSVLSLIRENSDIAPAVSTGTGRVSVMVKKGDTLFGISRRHGLKISELARLNGLEEPYTIKVGQTLYVAR